MQGQAETPIHFVFTVLQHSITSELQPHHQPYTVYRVPYTIFYPILHRSNTPFYLKLIYIFMDVPIYNQLTETQKIKPVPLFVHLGNRGTLFTYNFPGKSSKDGSAY